MNAEEERILQKWIHRASKKLAELDRKLDDIRDIQGGYLELYKELEEKLDIVGGWVEATKPYVEENRERLDAVESRSAGTSNYTRSLKERLDKLESSYSSKVWNIKLEEQIRKLEDMFETLMTRLLPNGQVNTEGTLPYEPNP